MNVNRLCIQTVLILWALTMLSFNSPSMAKSDSNADNTNADLSELPQEMRDEEVTKLHQVKLLVPVILF